MENQNNVINDTNNLGYRMKMRLKRAFKTSLYTALFFAIIQFIGMGSYAGSYSVGNMHRYGMYRMPYISTMVYVWLILWFTIVAFSVIPRKKVTDSKFKNRMIDIGWTMLFTVISPAIPLRVIYLLLANIDKNEKYIYGELKDNPKYEKTTNDIDGKMKTAKSEVKKEEVKQQENKIDSLSEVDKKTLKAKEFLKAINSNTNKLSNKIIINKLTEFDLLSRKIIKQTDENNVDSLSNFYDYYLPTVLKITNRLVELLGYNEVQETRNFDVKVNDTLGKVNKALTKLLASCVAEDIQQTSVDMETLESVMKMDGLL